MTIGIAAFGDRAGLAVIEGLKVAEAVGQGALHGFVSVVAIGRDGRLHRAAIQDGGTKALLAGRPLPDILAEARLAGLMSSGPNRPEPLSQFTPADPDVGLVTGHRFPNGRGASDRPLNDEVLDLMRQGLAPQAALARVIADNPRADAGFIALSRDGRLGAEDTPYVRGFGDAGRADGDLDQGGARVAVLHNAIRPHRSLAGLIVEVALSVLGSEQLPDAVIVFRAGVPVRIGRENAIEIDDAGRVQSVTAFGSPHETRRRSFGLGYQAPVRQRNVIVGRALYEPYLFAENGRIVSIDGGLSIELPVRSTRAGQPI